MDGTLFDSRTAIVPAAMDAFRQVIQESGVDVPLPSEVDVTRHIGESSRQFYLNITPPALHAHVDRVAELVRAGEKKRVETGQTKLFPGVAETLRLLKEAGRSLAYYSNSGPGYFYTVLRSHGILDIADAATCFGETKAGKAEMVAALKPKLGGGPLAVVGDRLHDIDAARANNALAVGVLYGFALPGELAKADIRIERFDLLPDVLAEK
jgi:phosphoglycolate phosphatase-like HAD superfamily hydrolase